MGIYTMRLNGRDVVCAKCTQCGQLENLALLDSADDGSGNFTILKCIRCYGPDWCPERMSDLKHSVVQSYANDYEHWGDRHNLALC